MFMGNISFKHFDFFYLKELGKSNLLIWIAKSKLEYTLFQFLYKFPFSVFRPYSIIAEHMVYHTQEFLTGWKLYHKISASMYFPNLWNTIPFANCAWTWIGFISIACMSLKFCPDERLVVAFYINACFYIVFSGTKRWRLDIKTPNTWINFLHLCLNSSDSHNQDQTLNWT